MVYFLPHPPLRCRSISAVDPPCLLLSTKCYEILSTVETGVSRRLADGIGGGLGVHEKCDDKTVKTQDFGENEDQDHADEESRLLSGSTDTGVTDDSDGKTWIFVSKQTVRVWRKTYQQPNRPDRRTDQHPTE